MPGPIQFYFDFSSPYGYLMSEKIDELAERFQRRVHWRPILLGVIFQATGGAPLVELAPPKAAYYKLDFARSARYLGIAFRLPSKFPLPTQQAARAYYWLHDQDCGLARTFAHATYRAFYVDDRDISAPETVIDIAAGLGVNRGELATALATQELKDRLKAEVDAAMACGVFGSPTVIVDGELFFGADRLPQLERWLAEGSF